MLTVVLNRNEDAKNLYTQLYDGIREQIISGAIEPDTRLPSKRALANHLDVSVKTIENAYYQLQIEGFVYTKPKSGFYVCKLNDYRQAERTREPFITRFKEDDYTINCRSNKNDPALFPASTWCKLMRECISYPDENLFATVPFNGIPELRIAIADYLLQEKGIEVSPDQIIIGAGTEYLYGRLIKLLGKDVTYAVEDPYYVKIKGIYKLEGVEYKAIPIDKDGMDIATLEASGCQIVHLSPAHNYPLGIATSIGRRVELLKWANKKKERYIIEDDYDSEFRYAGHPIKPLTSIDIRGKVIYMNTFSKTVSPSIRISYMVLPDELMNRYTSTMNFYYCTASRVDQLTLARFISGGYLERYVRSVTRHDNDIRKKLFSAIRGSEFYRYVKILEDTSGAHMLIKVPEVMSDRELTEWFRKKDMLVSCVSEYYVNESDEHKSTLIINYAGYNEQKIEVFIDIMEEFIIRVRETNLAGIYTNFSIQDKISS